MQIDLTFAYMARSLSNIMVVFRAINIGRMHQVKVIWNTIDVM